MGVIGFKKAKCKDCYKCVRLCPVKAITVQDEHAKFVASDCILCGQCLEACPQDAITVFSDIDRVKQYINDGMTVIASLSRHIWESIRMWSRASLSKACTSLAFPRSASLLKGPFM